MEITFERPPSQVLVHELEYWEEVESLAREALEAQRVHGQDADEALWELVDSHRWVIYTHLALQVPIFSKNCDDCWVEAADLSSVWRDRGLDGVASTIAFACLLGDAREKLEELRYEEEEEEDA